MITSRDRVRAKVEDLFGMLLGDTLSFGSILSVDNQHVNAVFLDIIGN
jgi:hypothetical protein